MFIPVIARRARIETYIIAVAAVLNGFAAGWMKAA